nr:uncharacterized protein LOC111502085 isoform X1 [Leptinotarsa decemlineata]
MCDEKISKFCKIISELKDKLKCTICLDVIQDSAELACGHKFCHGCYSEHKSKQKQPSCPLCKAVVRRRSVIYKDEFSDKLSLYVSKVADIFKKAYGCDVERMVSHPAAVTKRKTRNTEKNISEHEKPSTSKNPSKGSKVISEHEKPSTSKNSSKRRIVIPERENPSTLKKNSKESLVISERKKPSTPEKTSKGVIVSSRNDVFDKLRINQSPDNLLVNRTGTKRIYHNKKKQQQEKEYTHKILDFDDHETKYDVLRWLNDTRNKFERMTLTQSFDVENNDNISTTDLVSVSQVRQNESVPPLRSTTKCRPRARSLDISTKKVLDTRNREGSCVDVADNYVIEDADTEEEKIVKKVEENVLLNIIEDRYLDKLENEIQNKVNCETTPKNLPQEAQNTQPSTSGWERIGKIKKTLRKKEKAPKKLNITVKSSQASQKKDCTDSSIKNSAQKESPINLNKIQSPRQEDRVSSTSKASEDKAKGVEIQRKIPKYYDLNALETYICENIEILPKDDIFDDRNNEEDSDDMSNKENNENVVNKVAKNENVIVLENIVLKNNSLDESPTKDVEDPYLLPTQKLDTSNNSKSKNQADNNPFMMLTQKISTEADVDDVFLKATQKCRNRSKEIYDYVDLEERYETIEDVFDTLDSHLKFCKEKVSSTSISDKLDIVSRCVAKLREFVTEKTLGNTSRAIEITSFHDLCERGMQTSFNLSAKLVQTENCGNIDQEVQTEDIDEKADLSSSKSLKNVGHITQNSEKALHTITSESQANFENESSGAQEKQTVVAVTTQNNWFSATLDNFCFETQDITKENDKLNVQPETQAETQKRSVTNEAEKGSVIDEAKKESVTDEALALPEKADKSQKSTISVLVCSFSSEKANKVNRKLTYHDSVSTKRTLSDSDEEIIMPKRLCNRFIRDDLSVEFDVNTETQNTQNKKNDLEMPDSEGADFEDYLQTVLKKYEDNNDLITTPEKTDVCQNIEERDAEENPTAIPVKDPQQLEDNMMDCSEIVARVNENINKMKLDNTSRSSYKTACLSTEQRMQNVDLGLHQELDLKEEEDVRGQTESSDIIGETESMEPLPKRARKANLNVGFDQGEQASSALNLLGIANSENRKETVCQELDDSLDDAELANIQISEENRLHDNTKEQGEECVVEMNDETLGAQFNEEDLFSDDDIVETTPQKESSLLEKRSQRIPAYNLSFPPPSLLTSDDVIENFNFDFAPLPPPPDFQDTPREADKDDTDPSHITIIELEQTLKGTAQSLTPDGLLNYENKETGSHLNKSLVKSDLFGKGSFHSTPQRATPLDIQTKRISSTQLSQASNLSCTLSPITGVRSVIERAQTSTHTPLMISNHSARKQTIMTSTPKQKSMWNYVKSQNSDCEPARSKPCIACSRLSKDKTQSISLLTNKKLATYSQVFDKCVTHMIVTVTEKNWIKDYTMKFVAGVAAGIWILNFEWVQECLNSNSIVPEEPYEVLDDTGMPGPKTARLTRKENPLLKGFIFYCANSLFSTSKADVEEVIKMLGGKVVSTLEKLSEKDGKIGLIITEGRSTQDFEVYETWLETYKTVTVDIEWLSKSVGRYKLLSIRPYIWCSDDHLDDLGYPPNLTEAVQSSSSEQY